MDASALVEYLLQTERAPPVEDILRMADVDVHIPALCDVEVAAGLRRALATGALSYRRADEAILDYADLPLTRHGHAALLPRILGLRENFSAYDACYVALAERMQGALLTGDSRLARAAARLVGIPVLPA